MSQRAWDVFKDISNEYGTAIEHIDTVFFNDDCDAPYVYKSLVNHDDYDSNIFLKWMILDEYGDNIEIRYPSDNYEEGDEHDKESCYTAESEEDEEE